MENNNSNVYVIPENSPCFILLVRDNNGRYKIHSTGEKLTTVIADSLHVLNDNDAEDMLNIVKVKIKAIKCING